MKPKMKKPSAPCQGLLGQQQKYSRSAASTHYTKAPRTSRLPSPAEFYASAIAEFREARDQWAWGCCPFHADRNPSFCMNLRTGWYECKSSACQATGKSIVSFVCAHQGVSTKDAIRYLEGLA